MPRLREPTTPEEKIKELNRQYIDTKSIMIIMDCCASSALKMKKMCQEYMLSKGKQLPHATKIPTAVAVKVLMIDENRIRRQVEANAQKNNMQKA